MRKTSTRMLALALSVVTAVSSLTGFGGDVKAHAAENPSAVVAEVDENEVATATDAEGFSAKVLYTSADYYGGSIRPGVEIENEKGEKLEEGTDYTLSYQDNVLPGTAKVIITYKGDYKGSCEKTFTIKQASIDSFKATSISQTSIDFTWKDPNITMSRYVVMQLKNGKWQAVYTCDSELELEVDKLIQNTAYRFYVKGQRKLKSGKYVDVAKSSAITVRTKPYSYLYTEVKLSKTSFVYDGTAKTPSFKVVGPIGDKNAVLDSKTEYTYKFENNIYPGTATLKVTFGNKFTGSRTEKFKITPAKITGIKSSHTSNSVTIKCPAVKGATEYRVYKYTDKPTLLAKSNTTTINVKKLKQNTEYSFQIRAYTVKNGKSIMLAESEDYETYTDPEKVTGTVAGVFDKKDKNLVVDSSGKDWVCIGWTPVAGADGYYIYRYDTKSKKWVKCSDTQGSSIVPVKGDRKKIYWDISGLKSGTGYCFKVAAYKTRWLTLKKSVTLVGAKSDTIKAATLLAPVYGYDECYVFQEAPAPVYIKRSKFFRVELTGCSKNKGYYIIIQKRVNGKSSVYKKTRTNKSVVDIAVPENSPSCSYGVKIVPYTIYGGKIFTSQDVYNIPAYGNAKTKISKMSGVSKRSLKCNYVYFIDKDAKGKITGYRIQINQMKKKTAHMYEAVVTITKKYNTRGVYLGMEKSIVSKDIVYYYNAKNKLVKIVKQIIERQGKNFVYKGYNVYNGNGKLVEYQRYAYADDGYTVIGTIVYDGNGNVKRKTIW